MLSFSVTAVEVDAASVDTKKGACMLDLDILWWTFTIGSSVIYVLIDT